MKITSPRLLAVAALATGALIVGAVKQGGIVPLWAKVSSVVRSCTLAVQERFSGAKSAEAEAWDSSDADTPQGANANGNASVQGANGAGGTSATLGETGVASKTAAAEKEADSFLSPASMRERAAVLAKIKDKDSLSAEFKLFVADLTAENWKAAFDGILKNLYGKGLMGPGSWEALMAKIGQVAGNEAMENFRPADLLMGYEAYSARLAMQSWAAKDVEAAKQYLLTLPDGRFKDGMGIGLFQAMAGRDRAGLEGLFRTLPEAYWPQIAANLRDVIRWEQSRGGHPVRDWLQQTESALGKDSAQYRAVKQAAELHELEGAEFGKQPLRMAQLASEYFGNPTNVSDRVLSTSALALAGSQPQQALDYVDSLGGKRPALAATVPGIVTAWAKVDLGAPGEWLNQHPHSPFYDDTAAAYAQELKHEDPAASLQWAETIHDVGRKQATLKIINAK
jgi:hypothetical protein